MSAAHTPGPWRLAGRETRNLPHSLVAADTLLARVYSKHFGDVQEETANARLIAAAPELLEIARSVEGMVSNCDVSSGICCCGDSMENHADPMHCGHTPTDSGVHAASSLLKKARAAIAKATGENHENG